MRPPHGRISTDGDMRLLIRAIALFPTPTKTPLSIELKSVRPAHVEHLRDALADTLTIKTSPTTGRTYLTM